MIELRNLNKEYGYRKILDDVNLTLAPGEIVGILGPNAEGKSTLIKILAGHINEYSGEYIFEGRSFGYLNKNDIGYVSDKPIMPNSWTVNECIDYYKKYFVKFNEKKALFLLDKFNIHLQRKVKVLSKGENEKLHLALALSIDASLYLLDEPLASVDLIAREEIMRAIIDNFEQDSCMVIVSHLVRDIEKILDRALFLKGGKFISDVKVQEVLKEKSSLVDIYTEMFWKK